MNDIIDTYHNMWQICGHPLLSSRIVWQWIFSLLLRFFFHLPPTRLLPELTMSNMAGVLLTNKKCTFILRYHYLIFASQGLRFGSPFSPPLADLEYILRIRALVFHWLRLPVHIPNQKTFYTKHMLSKKCKQRWHRNALIWPRFVTSRFGSNENIFPVC